MAQAGYTLPVFAVAAAKAALLRLISPDPTHLAFVRLNLLPDLAEIPIEQIAPLDATSALAISRSDPGDNLDLTRHTPIWAWVQLQPRSTEVLVLRGGEGLGKTLTGNAAIYGYAQSLFEANLLDLIPADQTLLVTIILPEGRELAQRTSNEAFGIVDGLALLGTSGISQPLSTETHLAQLRNELQAKIRTHPRVIFCVGSHGFQVAERLGLPREAIAQTGNWVGALLVEAALQGAESVLLLGYHGKLIKLAGGIFNTSSHLADAKLEIIAAAIATLGGTVATQQTVLAAKTADAAYQYLRSLHMAQPIFQHLVGLINQKAQAYVQKYADRTLPVGTILFDRQGEVMAQDYENWNS